MADDDMQEQDQSMPQVEPQRQISQLHSPQRMYGGYVPQGLVSDDALDKPNPQTGKSFRQEGNDQLMNTMRNKWHADDVAADPQKKSLSNVLTKVGDTLGAVGGRQGSWLGAVGGAGRMLSEIGKHAKQQKQQEQQMYNDNLTSTIKGLTALEGFDPKHTYEAARLAQKTKEAADKNQTQIDKNKGNEALGWKRAAQRDFLGNLQSQLTDIKRAAQDTNDYNALTKRAYQTTESEIHKQNANSGTQRAGAYAGLAQAMGGAATQNAGTAAARQNTYNSSIQGTLGHLAKEDQINLLKTHAATLAGLHKTNLDSFAAEIKPIEELMKKNPTPELQARLDLLNRLHENETNQAGQDLDPLLQQLNDLQTGGQPQAAPIEQPQAAPARASYVPGPHGTVGPPPALPPGSAVPPPPGLGGMPPGVPRATHPTAMGKPQTPIGQQLQAIHAERGNEHKSIPDIMKIYATRRAMMQQGGPVSGI